MSSMNEETAADPSSTTTWCQYPGCEDPDHPGRPRRAAERSGDRGRQPLYCGQRDEGGPLHTRQNANAEVQRRQARTAETLRRGGIQVPINADAEKVAPVDLARASAGVLLEEMRRTAAEQAATAQKIVTQLAAAADPTVLETQLQASTTAARADVAKAEAARAAAEQALQAATVQAAAAAAVADAANTAAEDAEAAREAATAEAVQAVENAASAEQALLEEKNAHQETRAELDAQIEATGEQTHRAEQAEAEAETAVQALRAEQDTHTETRTHLEATAAELARVRAAAETAAAVAVERERSLTSQAVQLTAQLDQARAQIEQLHTQVRTADAVAGRESARAERAETESQRLAQALQDEKSAHTSTRAELTTNLDQARAQIE